MSDRAKFANQLKEFGDILLKIEAKEAEVKRSAAGQPQEQQHQAKKARVEEPAASQPIPASSYQKLKDNNRSMKEVLEHLKEVNQMSNISDAHRATLITAIMREGGLEAGDSPASSSSSSSSSSATQQQQHPYEQLQQQQQQLQQQQQQQQQQPQQQPQEDQSRLTIPGDRAGRRTYLEEVLGPFGASLFASPEGGTDHQQQGFRNENAALNQTLNQTLASRLEAGEEPGLLGFAAMGSQQRADQ